MKIIITEQQLNSGLPNLFNNYITKVYPELLSKNTILKINPDEATVYVINPQFKSFGLNAGIAVFIHVYYTTGDKRLYLEDNYISILSNVFGEDKWAELFLNWFNNQYEEKLKNLFNELEWEITGVE
jgi:hypothetical protein